MKSLAVLAVLVVLVNVASCSNCRCVFGSNHPQDRFCTSDFVVRGLVTSDPVHKTITIPRNDDPTKSWSRKVIHYKVLIMRIFKGEKKVRQTPELKHYPGELHYPVEVTLSTDDNECAAKLEPGMEYVLGGYIDKSELEIFTCNWIETWNSLGRGELLGIKMYYGRNCACRTSLCSWMDPLGHMMDYYCSMGHLYCALRKDKATCKWKDMGRGYQDCIKDATSFGIYRR